MARAKHALQEGLHSARGGPAPSVYAAADARHLLHVENGDHGGDEALDVSRVGVDASLLQQLRYDRTGELEDFGELLWAGAVLRVGGGVFLLHEEHSGLHELSGVNKGSGCGSRRGKRMATSFSAGTA